MNKVVVVLFGFILMLISNDSVSADATGKLVNVRVTTNEHQNESTRGLMIFKLTSAIHNDCPWLFIASDNQYFASVLLVAVAKDQNVKVWYNSTPEKGLCRAYTVELL